jgi:hypothetical protein
MPGDGGADVFGRAPLHAAAILGCAEAITEEIDWFVFTKRQPPRSAKRVFKFGTKPVDFDQCAPARREQSLI